MRRSSFVCGLALGLALACSTLSARADDDDDAEEYPLQFAQRPLTLHARSLSPVVSLDVTRLVHDPNDVTRALETNLTIQAGAAFGITKSLEVSAALAQIQILPSVAYGNPTLGATLSVVRTAFELGLRANVTVVTASDKAGVILEPFIPARFHIGKAARLDFGAGVPISLQKGVDQVFGIEAPFGFALNLVDTLHVGAQTNVLIPDLKNPGTTLTLPLGFFAGFSIGTDHPIFEIDPYFTWPKFAQPGATDPGSQKLNVDLFTAGVALRGYFYF